MRKTIASVGACIFAMCSAIAHAQQAGVAATNVAANGEDSSQLQEVVVTAQRRSERLQDVPISVTVATAAALKDADVTSALDLPQATPGLSIQYGTGTYTPFIRGVGNPVAVAGNEASTSTYIDGIYVARVFADVLPFYDVDQVEVLKGPQGTLFGRNSTGGLINLITRSPTQQTEFEGSVGYGNYDTGQFSMYAATPLGPRAAINVAVSDIEQGDSWGHNVTTGQTIGRQAVHGLRSKLVVDATDSTEVTLSAGYVQAWNNFSPASNPTVGTNQGNPAGFPATIYNPLPFYDVRNNNSPSTHEESFDTSLRVKQDLGFGQFASITGYRRSGVTVFNDYDYLPINYFNANLIDDEEQFSQELQLLSKADSRFKWIIGAYYLWLDSAYNPATFSGEEFGGINAQLYGQQNTNSHSEYAQASFDVMPRLTLTLGGRYTRDWVAADGRTDVAAPGGSPVLVHGVEAGGGTAFTKATYRAALDYQITDSSMVYASWSTGFKSGVYNTLPIDPVPARPELVTAYEVGSKNEYLGRRLLVNSALFLTTIRDPQVDELTNATNTTVNAQSARVRGAELEVQFVASDQLRFRASASYTDAIYTGYYNAPFTTGTGQLVNGMVPGCSTLATGNINPANGGNVDYCAGDANGYQLPHSPKVLANMGLNYTLPIYGGKLAIAPTLSYNGGFYWDPDNRTRQPSYALLDATLSYLLPGDHWTVRLWGKNLTDKQYYAYVAEEALSQGNPGAPAAPRTYGISVDFKL
jgi:iron complex outermembrane receptor protein